MSHESGHMQVARADTNADGTAGGPTKWTKTANRAGGLFWPQNCTQEGVQTTRGVDTLEQMHESASHHVLFTDCTRTAGACRHVRANSFETAHVTGLATYKQTSAHAVANNARGHTNTTGN